MAANQQFCLRWNNHQRTLISVFDSLLESRTLVDCTLAAEGQYLEAHKVVLSACSPYLGVLLSSHHEKHPILILKDIKFQELKAMLDYMYRGEVNISQEQLCTFLKAAESLQIKGLTESAGLNPETKDFEERIVKRYDRKCGSGGGIPPVATGTSQQQTIPNHNTARTRSPPAPNALPNAATAVASIDQHHHHTTSPSPSSSWNAKFVNANFRCSSPPSAARIRDGSLSPTMRKRRKQQHPMPSSEDVVSSATAMNNGTASTLLASSLVVENHQDSVDHQHETTNNVAATGRCATPTTNPATMSVNAHHHVKSESNQQHDKLNDINETRSTDSGSNGGTTTTTTTTTTNSLSKTTTTSNELPLVVPKCEPKYDDRHSDVEAAYDDSVEEMTIEDEEEEIDEMDLSRPGPSHSDDSQNYGSNTYPLSSVNDTASGQIDCQADQFIMMNDETYHWAGIDEGENTIFGLPSSASPLKAALSKPPLLQIPDLMQNTASKGGTGAAVTEGGQGGAKFIACSKCGRQYKLKSSLLNHQRWECGKEPQFKCVLCSYKAKQKVHLVTHMRYKHALKPDVFTLK